MTWDTISGHRQFTEILTSPDSMVVLRVLRAHDNQGCTFQRLKSTNCHSSSKTFFLATKLAWTKVDLVWTSVVPSWDIILSRDSAAALCGRSQLPPRRCRFSPPIVNDIAPSRCDVGSVSCEGSPDKRRGDPCNSRCLPQHKGTRKATARRVKLHSTIVRSTVSPQPATV